MSIGNSALFCVFIGMRLNIGYVLLLFILYLSACKSTQMTDINSLSPDTPVPASHIHVPVEFSKTAFEHVINREIPEVLYENLEVESDQGAVFHIAARRDGPIRTLLEGKKMFYTVPIQISINQGKLLGGLESKGKLELRFLTQWEIGSTWELNTETTLEEYHWVEKPVLRVLGISIPIRLIGDFIVRQSRSTLTQLIDKEIRETANLKERVLEYWEWVKKPFLVDEDYNIWLQLDPREFAMSPVEVDQDTVRTAFWMKAITNISIGEKPEQIQVELPAYKMTDTQEASFYIHLDSELSYENLESQLKETVVGEEFKISGQEVRVTSFSLYSRQDKIQVVLQLEGDIKGKAFAEGVPYYDASSNELKLRLIQTDLKTKHFFWKHATRLFKKKIEKKIESLMHIQIRENLKELENQLARDIQHIRVNEYLTFEGNLEHMDLTQCFLTDEGVKIVLSSKGTLMGQVKFKNIP